MSQTTFYVLDNSVPPKLVAAQYLYYNGAPVADPNASAKQTEIYNANGSLFGFNAGGYLIVPANYTLSGATNFASSVAKAMTFTYVGPNGETVSGLPTALGLMTGAFLRGGPQDLQRTYNGTTNGPFVPAFVDAASFNLGVITAYAGLPLSWSEAGGGGYNVLTSFGRILQNQPPLNTGGALGLSPANTQSVQAGYSLGQKLPGAPPAAEADPPKINILPSAGDFFTSAFIIPAAGSAIELALNPTAGGSQEWLVNVGNGVDDEGFYYSAANETGTLEHENVDLASGGSEEELFTGLPADLVVQATFYTGPNETGSLGTTVDVETGGVLTDAADGGLIITGAPATVTNSGAIVASDPSGIAVELADGTTVNNSDASALIDGGAYGVWMPDGSGTVTNNGTIIGTNDYGIEIGGTATVINDLLITGANGVSAAGRGTLTNDGTVDGTNGNGVFFGDGGSVTNVAGKLIAGTSGGVIITSATGVIVNSGSIFARSGEAAELASGGTVSNLTAEALIDGDYYGVWMPDGPGSVVNQGSIIGTNDYGIEIGGAGTITNDLLVEGANGIDTSGAGTLTNVGIIIATNGSGVFFGDGGSVTNYAGKSIRGTSGGVIITSATGTLVNSGSIVASAGEAAELASGGTVSNLATAALIDGGYYGVWMPDGPGSVVNHGSIIGTNDYGIEIGGAGNITNNLLVEGANGIDTSGAGTLTNAGSVIATNGSGVFFGDGGSVTNDAGRSIKGTSGGVIITSATGMLVNSGSIVASAGEAAELASGGTVNNAAGAMINGDYYGVWMPDGPGSVVNQGSIIGTNDYGIEIGGAGNITNDLLVEGANGIDTSGAGTLTNAGSIIATNGSGVFFGDGGSVTNDAGKSIKGTSGGVIITSATGKVINDGTIAASSGEAVELASGGTVSNATASTVIDGDYYGVWMPDGSGSVTNDGTIIGTNDYGIEIGGNGANVTNSGLIKGATGVDFAGTGGTLTTSGTIVGTGGVAVDIGTQNKLVAEAGATFVGKVLDPGGSDSLELAGAAPGSLAGLGSTIAGFGAVGVDAGSDWTLRGSSTAEDFLVDGTATVAAGGRLDIATIDPASTGLMALAAGAALEVGQAAARQTRMTFLGGNTLVIDHATAFGINVGSTAYAGPLLQGFGPGDTIDLKDIAPVGLQLVHAGAPGVLEIASAGAVKASLLFGASELAGLSLHLAGDGHGGTRLTAG